MTVLGHLHFTVATLLAVVQAAIGLAIAFGAGLTPAQSHAVVELVIALAAVLPLGGALVSHAHIRSGGGAP